MKNRVEGVVIEKAVRSKLNERGVQIKEIAKIVYQLQIHYQPDLTIEECEDSVEAVLRKREIQHAILVGIELDMLAEKGLLSEPLLSIISSDEPLFGVDETVAIGSVFGFGSIALTTFGYLDKEKVGIIKELDQRNDEVHTFLDDLVASIAANAAARLAHHKRDQEEMLAISNKKHKGKEELIG